MKTKSSKKTKLIIGARDKIDLPEFNLLDLPSKIDTGAATSAIHCYKVQLKEINGREIISFRLLDPSHEAYNGKEFRTENFTEKKITSSTGHSEYRYVIKSKVVIFGKEIETEFTLADRNQMRYPVLLGRKLLRHRFIVDVSKKDLSYQEKNKVHET